MVTAGDDVLGASCPKAIKEQADNKSSNFLLQPIVMAYCQHVNR